MKPVCLTAGQNFGRVHKKTRLNMAWLSITSYGAYDTYEKHYHENSYVSMVVAGCYTETNQQGTTMFNTGDSIYRPASYTHANNFVGKAGMCFNVEFTPDSNEALSSDLALSNSFQAFSPGTFPDLHKALLAFKTGNENDVPELLIHWLIELNQPKLKETNLLWILKVKQILTDELTETHTLHSLAQRVHVHPVYLANYFKQKTGLTVGEFIQQTRVRKAFHLLTSTTNPVTEIALEAGYFDAAHFIRHFSKVYGVSPAKFRKATCQL